MPSLATGITCCAWKATICLCFANISIKPEIIQVEILKISSIILKTKKYKTLEEQFYGITVLDDRIVDTSKVTIKEIYSVDDFLDLDIKVGDRLVGVRFLSKKDKTYLPVLKKINNWRLIDEENNYKIYHGYTSGVDSDALKITKNNKNYYIDLSLPHGGMWLVS